MILPESLLKMCPIIHKIFCWQTNEHTHRGKYMSTLLLSRWTIKITGTSQRIVTSVIDTNIKGWIRRRGRSPDSDVRDCLGKGPHVAVWKQEFREGDASSINPQGTTEVTQEVNQEVSWLKTQTHECTCHIVSRVPISDRKRVVSERLVSTKWWTSNTTLHKKQHF